MFKDIYNTVTGYLYTPTAADILPKGTVNEEFLSPEQLGEIPARSSGFVTTNTQHSYLRALADEIRPDYHEEFTELYLSVTPTYDGSMVNGFELREVSDQNYSTVTNIHNIDVNGDLSFGGTEMVHYTSYRSAGFRGHTFGPSIWYGEDRHLSAHFNVEANPEGNCTYTLKKGLISQFEHVQDILKKDGIELQGMSIWNHRIDAPNITENFKEEASCESPKELKVLETRTRDPYLNLPPTSLGR